MLFQQSKIDSIIIFIAGIFLFTIGLASQEIISFESRFYVFALEMWRQGPTWFPTTYHQYYPDYPGMATFLIYLSARLFDGLNKFTAVFPSACAAAFTLVMTYLIGALQSRRWGICAVLFLFFTVAFVTEARTISLDQYTTAITTLCFYLAYSAQLKQKNKRLGWIIPLLILGFACRGPIGLVIPAGVLCAFYLVEKKLKYFFILSVTAGLLLVLCTAVLLGIAYQLGGMPFLQDVLSMQVFGRLEDIRTPPVYFYFVESLGAYALAYPVACLVLLNMLLSVFKRKLSVENKFLLKLFAWVLVVMVGLSIPGDKKVRYILAIAPALALIAAYVFVAPNTQRYLGYVRQVVYGLFFIFPLICMVALLQVYQKHLALDFSYLMLEMFFLVLQCGIVICYWKFKKNDLLVLGIAAFSFVMAYMLIIEPINLKLNQTRPFVLQVEALRKQEKAELIFYREGSDGLVIKYLANMPEEDEIVFMKKPEELQSIHQAAFIMVSEENVHQLPEAVMKNFKILLHGKLGREPVVVLQRA